MRKDKLDNGDILTLLHLASIPLPWGKMKLNNIAKRNKLFHFLKKNLVTLNNLFQLKEP